MLREALYRLNELALNNRQLTKDDVKDLYQKILATAAEIAQAELEDAKAASASAAAAREEAVARKAGEINKILDTLGPEKGPRFLERMGIQ